MAHFAEIDASNNKVVRVLVISDEQCDAHNGQDSSECETWVKDNHGPCPYMIEKDFGGTWPTTYWKRTSYNTKFGEHNNGGTPFRGNYAGRGKIYDASLDAFYEDKEFPSWVLNTTKFKYEAPIAIPTPNEHNGNSVMYEWDEAEQTWDGIEANAERTPLKWDKENLEWVLK